MHRRLENLSYKNSDSSLQIMEKILSGKIFQNVFYMNWIPLILQILLTGLVFDRFQNIF